jgi:hypothetical protein
MKMKIGDVLVYRDSELSGSYGTGVVISVFPEEYAILWSGRGLTKYRRAILDKRIDDVFQRVEGSGGVPKERQLNLGTAKTAVAFNENYSRSKLELLCEKLKLSDASGAKDVADGLTAEFFTKKLALRGGTKVVLRQLAELCAASNKASSDAREISKELFFGYVIQRSDFVVIDDKH